MTLKNDRIVSVFFFVIAIFLFLFIDDIKMPSNLTEPGPRIMPYLSVFLMMSCCLGVFVESFKKKDDKLFLSKVGFKKLLKIISALVLYTLGLLWLGFLVSTPFLAYALINMLSGDNKINFLKRIFASIIITYSIYLMFYVGFNVMLPPGSIFD